VVFYAPKEVPIERIPYEDLLPFPRIAARPIRAQLLAKQKGKRDEEVKAPK
jgi:hypothetical protein